MLERALLSSAGKVQTCSHCTQTDHLTGPSTRMSPLIICFLIPHLM